VQLPNKGRSSVDAYAQISMVIRGRQAPRT
jgi:hypothetical protein